MSYVINKSALENQKNLQSDNMHLPDRLFLFRDLEYDCADS